MLGNECKKYQISGRVISKWIRWILFVCSATECVFLSDGFRCKYIVLDSLWSTIIIIRKFIYIGCYLSNFKCLLLFITWFVVNLIKTKSGDY